MAKGTKQPNSLVVRGSFACICKVRDEGYKWEWDYIQNQKRVNGLHIQWHYQPMRISLEWHFPSGAYQLHSVAHEGIFSDKEVITQLYREGIDPARYYLINQLEERLEGHVNPELNLFNTKQLLMVPDSLLSALYLSFALEVSEQMEPKMKCKCGCGRDFFPEKGKSYYDERCKKRDWWRNNRGSRKQV